MAIIGGSVGRLVGPPTARTIIDTPSGQTAYALQQFCVSLVALVVIEIKVMEELHKMDEDFDVNILRTEEVVNSQETQEEDKLEEE